MQNMHRTSTKAYGAKRYVDFSWGGVDGGTRTSAAASQGEKTIPDRDGVDSEVTPSPSRARVSDVPALCVIVPLRTISASNAREHWAARSKRVKRERTAIAWSMREASAVGVSTILAAAPVIRLTRVTAPRGKILDDDNLRGCLKAVRDGVADWLGINDNDPRVSWHYAQRNGTAWGVEVEVFA